MAVDGILRFDTKIDTDGFSSGTKEISSKMLDLKNKIEKTESEISSLQQELEKLANTPVKSSTVANLEKDIAKAKAELSSLYGQADLIGDTKQADLESMGLGTDYLDNMLEQDASWQKIQQQITETEAKLQSYEQELKNVRASETEVSGKDTAEYQRKQQKLQTLSGQLEVYKARLKETEAKENSNTNAAKRSVSALERLKNIVSKAGKAMASAFKNATVNIIKKIGSHAKKSSSQMGGLAKSFNMVKQALKGMIVYQGLSKIFDAVKEGMQNLAQVSPQTNKSLSMLMSALTRLKNAFVTAFAPILNVVAPILTTFINLLSNVADKIAQFATVLTGKNTYTKATEVQQDYAQSIEDTTKATKDNTKATEKNLAGYDQLNVMQQDSGSSSKSSKLQPKDMFSTATVSGAVSDFAKKLKDLFAKQNFEGIGSLIGSKINEALQKIDWGKIRKTVKSWATNIAKFLNGAIAKIDFSLVGSTIGNALMTVIEFAYKFVANFDFKKFGNAIAQILNGLINTINFSTLAAGLSTFAIGFLDTLTETLSSIDWNKFSKAVVRFISNIKWGSMGGAVTGLINSFAKALKSTDFKSIGNALKKGISSVNWKNIWKSLSNAVSGVIQSIADLFGLKGINTSNLNSSLKKLYDPVKKIWNALKKMAENIVEPLVNDLLPAIVDAIGDVFDGVSPIVKALTPIFKTLIKDVAKVVKALSPVIKAMGEAISTTVENVGKWLQPMLDLIAKVAEVLAPAVEGVFKFVNEIYKLMSPLYEFVGNIIGALVGNTDEQTISGKLRTELDNLSSVSEDLTTVSDNINGAMSEVDQSLQGSVDDIQYVDDLKDRMDELLSKSTLTDDDMTELNTIADLIAEKYRDFEKTWNDMTIVDNNGNRTLKENQEKTKKAIDDTIKSLKTQYATEALSEQYKELYKEKVEANQKVKKAQDKVTEATETAESYQNKYNDALANYKEACDNYVEGDKASYDAREDAIEQLSEAESNQTLYNQALSEAKGKLSVAEKSQSDLNTKMESMEGVIGVVSGKIKDSKGHLQELRDTIDMGFMTEEEVEKQFKVAGDTIYKGSKSLTERMDQGWNNGISESENEVLLKSKTTFVQKPIGLMNEGWDVHSPSKVTEKLAGYVLAGFVETIQNDGTAEKAIHSWIERVVRITKSGFKAMKSYLLNIPNVFKDIFSKVWSNTKPVLNQMLNGFENFFNYLNRGLNGLIRNLNSVSASIGKSTKTSYYKYPTFDNIVIPRLATGTVVPANYGEFLAVLGDNKREAEVVSPISTIKQALIEAMAEIGSTGDSGDINLTVNLDGEVIFNNIVKRNNAVKKRHGVGALG